jgi:hypothetical protein
VGTRHGPFGIKLVPPVGGPSTDAIAARLHIPRHTLRDQRKAIALSGAGSDHSGPEEEKVILATVRRILDTIAYRDKEGMSELLVPEGCATQSRDHRIFQTPLRDFPQKMPGGTARLEERFYNPRVLIDDDIAMVWAHYDFLVDGEVHHWGTNILSLLKQDGQWRVCAVTDNGRTGPRPTNWEVS